MRIAALDLGSNSFHLLVAQVHPDGSFEALARDKEMLRLGSLVGASGAVGEPAATAAVDTVRRFMAQADSLGADEVVACATAALREAADSGPLLDRIKEATGVRVRVISGKEEARLIFAALQASVVVDPAPALAADLGGGSLELMVGDQSSLFWATSLKLGVGRLTAELVRSDPPSAGDRRRLVHAVTTGLSTVLPELVSRQPRMAIASSGTLTSILRLGAGNPTQVNQLAVRAAALERTGAELLQMTSEQRSNLPGIDARRADLLPAGVVVATTLMELTGIGEWTGCEWALREGMVLDALRKRAPAEWSPAGQGLRRHSVVSLGRRCNWSEAHSEKVARLALRLFDGTGSLHGLGPEERELLEYGALLHDIGEHVSTDAHEQHSAYLIEHGRLRGFSPQEVAVLACLARFHKARQPEDLVPTLRRPGSRGAREGHQADRAAASSRRARSQLRRTGGGNRRVLDRGPSGRGGGRGERRHRTRALGSPPETRALRAGLRHGAGGGERAAPAAPRNRGLVSGHLAPGPVLVHPDVPGEPEKPLSEDVAHHF
ncbi:MAG: HD domain-containing protein [Acidimicrobiales bacterium]